MIRMIDRNSAPLPASASGGKRVAVVVCVALIGAVICSSFRLTEQIRVHSPDGRFYAVAASRIWQSYLPMSPGGGSDKPGYVTIFTKQGTPCGTVHVPMIWMIEEIQWSATTAHLRTVAEWDLTDHEVP